jgi:hypothetical protein
MFADVLLLFHSDIIVRVPQPIANIDPGAVGEVYLGTMFEQPMEEGTDLIYTDDATSGGLSAIVHVLLVTVDRAVHPKKYSFHARNFQHFEKSDLEQDMVSCVKCRKFVPFCPEASKGKWRGILFFCCS